MKNGQGTFKLRVSTNELAKPVITFARANALAQVMPTPFLALSPSRVEHNVRTLRKELPGVKLYYAMKSNPDLDLLRLLKDRVDGIDVASYGEVSITEEVGITPDRLIHSNPIKKEIDIQKCVHHGVRWFTFDNMDEIPKLQRFAPNSNRLLSQ